MPRPRTPDQAGSYGARVAAERTSAARTKIARKRLERGISQRALADAVGMTRSTYWRLEQGRNPNPPLGYLINLAIALDCRLLDLIEEEWVRWHVLSPGAPRPPRRSELWSPEALAAADAAALDA